MAIISVPQAILQTKQWNDSCSTACSQHGKVHVDEAMLVTEVHVTETASEASLHAIAEAVAEFAIGD